MSESRRHKKVRSATLIAIVGFLGLADSPFAKGESHSVKSVADAKTAEYTYADTEVPLDARIASLLADHNISTTPSMATESEADADLTRNKPEVIVLPNGDVVCEVEDISIEHGHASLSKELRTVKDMSFMFNEAIEVTALRGDIEGAKTIAEVHSLLKTELLKQGYDLIFDAMPKGNLSIGKLSDLDLDKTKLYANNLITGFGWMPQSLMQASGVKRIYLTNELSRPMTAEEKATAAEDEAKKPESERKPVPEIKGFGGIAYTTTGELVLAASAMLNQEFAKQLIAHEIYHHFDRHNCGGAPDKDNFYKILIPAELIKRYSEMTSDDHELVESETVFPSEYAMTDIKFVELKGDIAAFLIKGKFIKTTDPNYDSILRRAVDEVIRRYETVTPGFQDLAKFASRYSEVYGTPHEIVNKINRDQSADLEQELRGTIENYVSINLNGINTIVGLVRKGDKLYARLTPLSVEDESNDPQDNWSDELVESVSKAVSGSDLFRGYKIDRSEETTSRMTGTRSVYISFVPEGIVQKKELSSIAEEITIEREKEEVISRLKAGRVMVARGAFLTTDGKTGLFINTVYNPIIVADGEDDGFYSLGDHGYTVTTVDGIYVVQYHKLQDRNVIHILDDRATNTMEEVEVEPTRHLKFDDFMNRFVVRLSNYHLEKDSAYLVSGDMPVGVSIDRDS